MKNIFVVVAFITVPCHAIDTPEEEKLTVNIVNQNHNHNNHTIKVLPKTTDPFDCTHYYGNELKLRMADLTKEELSKNLIRFSPNKRNNYLASLTPTEGKLIDSTLDTEERALLKKSLGEEAEKIADILQRKTAEVERQRLLDESFVVQYFTRMLGQRWRRSL